MHGGWCFLLREVDDVDMEWGLWSEVWAMVIPRDARIMTLEIQREPFMFVDFRYFTHCINDYIVERI